MERLANQQGLNLIKVNKALLLNYLKSNLEAHITEYNEAFLAFKEQAIKQLRSAIKKAKQDKIESISFLKPECHINDYKTVIGMLEMSIDEEVYITSREFEQYVEDRWSWTDRFKTLNATYKG